MKATLVSLLSAIVPALAAPSGINRRADPGLMAGKYIIQLKPGTSPEAVTAHHNAVRSLLRRRDGAAGEVEKTFQIGDFNAYSGSFDGATLATISELDEVLVVEPDTLIYLEPTETPATSKRDLTTQTSSIWSLGDLSHLEAGATEYVYDESAGEGTTAYVFDTGIRLSHEEFEGRARFGINGVTGSTEQTGTNSDTSGHGTHVAATIVGKTYGVAKKATVVDVKVFDGDTGSTSWILTGMTWAIDEIVSKGAQNSSVLNLSLSSVGGTTALDNAVLAAYQQGVLAVVAAGNSNQPTTDVSPARLPQSFTVGMTQPDRGRVNIIEDIYGSNYGPELDVFAPGRDIISAAHTSDTGTATKTGTSMAAPLVAGLVCYLRGLESGLGTPDAATNRILELAIPDVVGDPKGSPNLLVNNGSGR
ncbi:Alkaline protease 1 [Colletotrichum fructicola]|uniref:Alkaline protease 1 n=1 Tax=Colletotrichum fructicola (strain Nara gc5) TaxID=1213859 RepID=A0A7J6J8N0_COLFN|nr:Alkaline protease 1 [Colletotrichum fructicola]KAF4486211.1 Alkaline protease 1 [Colletotrichum fructicola Nara gc5]KAI8281188.1 Alkaline protease 1 [Colletotrichum sp. SAR11_57]KAE9583504.1 Alkaline protease 1 [Colletotrichum fructicola]KAF4433555.1 Alkaline protease 1 [Colletotrichum fructicola]KAF4886412.1 Alkaline protease 1 [Colletotrichum fructicola]